MPNDVWNGQRLEPEDAHLEPYRGKLGFSRMIELRRARAWLAVAEPSLTGQALDARLRAAYDAAHAKDETYAETSRRLSAQWARQSQEAFTAGKIKRPVNFTREEMERLIEHFTGANDPVAQSILTKVQKSI